MGLAMDMHFRWRQGVAFNHRRDCSQRVLFIDQEAPCLAGVLSDGAEILTGNCNFHMTISILPTRSVRH